MKKLALLIGAAAISQMTMAQLSLSGTSYTQNFDNIGTALPVGWSLYTGATSSALGNDVTATKYTAAATQWTSTTGGFRNSASANGQPNFAAIGTNTAAQAAVTDRALSVRQVGYTSSSFPQSDSGAAFVLHIANTASLTNFQLAFNLQSLDSTSARATTWTVDYGFGSNPTSFTSATVVGNRTVGGNSFSNNALTVNFGTALDNQSGEVWIRIAALNVSVSSTGGSRTTTGIDDFNLTWTGAAPTVYNPVVMSLSPANNSINVPVASNLMVTFDRSVNKGTGNIFVKNVTDQTSQTIAVTASNVAIANNQVTISGVTLAMGKSYYVTYDSTAFDTAGFVCKGIYDTTDWTFSTIAPPPPPMTNLTENFDTTCGAMPSHLPARWMKYSVVGSQQWNCTAFGYNSTAAVSINGYQGGNNLNEDWLLTPQLDLSAMANPTLNFRAFKKFAGDDIHVLVSSNYTGVGDPNAATWTDLNVNFATVDTNWNVYMAALNSHKATPFFIGFKYTSTTTSAAQWKLDEISLTNPITGIQSMSKAALNFTIVGTATANDLAIITDVKAGTYKASIVDLTGKVVFTQELNCKTGKQAITIAGFHLSNGMYLLNLSNGKEQGTAKFIVE